MAHYDDEMAWQAADSQIVTSVPWNFGMLTPTSRL